MKPFEFWLGGWFTWGYIGGAAVSAAGSYLSRKKAAKPIPLEEIDLQEEQGKAIAGNLANQDSIEALISRGNAFSADQATSLSEKTMPGFGALRESLTSRATDLAENPYELPEDVQTNLKRLAAERGVAGGTRGEFNEFSLIRDFGIESLKFGRENLNQAQSIAGVLSAISPKVNPMSPLSFYVTPQETATVAAGNAAGRQAIAQGGENATTAASNANSADLWGSLTKIAGLFMNEEGDAGTPSRQPKISKSAMAIPI